MVDVIHKKDFVEIKYTGKEGSKIFDSNIEQDLKQISPEKKPKKSIIIVGEKMVLPGLDNALEGKEIGKEYEINLAPRDAFGNRDRNLVKTIPLKIFTEQKINPYHGQTLFLDQMIARIITVSGSRVLTDFNHPLAGKSVSYKFTIIRKVTDEKEKAESFFNFFFGITPEFEIKEKVLVSISPQMESLVKIFAPKFKELFGKDLDFKIIKLEEKTLQ